MKVSFFILFAFIPLLAIFGEAVGVAKKKRNTHEEFLTRTTKEGNYLTHRNGGPVDYHIDLSDPFRLVDGTNQLIATATYMLSKNPSRIFDIGLGIGCIPRYLTHKHDALTVDSADLDFTVIQEWSAINQVYFKTNQELQRLCSPPHMSNPSPQDAETLITQAMRAQKWSVALVDILDENYANPKNLLNNHKFFEALGNQVTSGIVVSLYKPTEKIIAEIKKHSRLPVALLLTFAPRDTAGQKDFSVLVLGSSWSGLSCKNVDGALALVDKHNIQKPSCKVIS